MISTTTATDALDFSKARLRPTLSKRLVRCLIVMMYVGILAGYGYVLMDSGHEPPAPLSRVN